MFLLLPFPLPFPPLFYFDLNEPSTQDLIIITINSSYKNWAASASSSSVPEVVCFNFYFFFQKVSIPREGEWSIVSGIGEYPCCVCACLCCDKSTAVGAFFFFSVFFCFMIGNMVVILGGGFSWNFDFRLDVGRLKEAPWGWWRR